MAGWWLPDATKWILSKGGQQWPLFSNTCRTGELIQLLPMCFLYSKDSYGSPPHRPNKKPKAYGINTDPAHKAIFYSVSFWFFYLPSLRDAYKNSQLCKSSFVSSPVSVWQFVHSAVLYLAPFLSCLPGFSAGISAGVPFIIVIAALGFLPWVPLAGLFIVHHQAAVGCQHCPFRALLKWKAPPGMAGLYRTERMNCFLRFLLEYQS